MNHDQARHRPLNQDNPLPFWRTRYALGLLVFGAVAAYFLLSEHRAHFISALPFLLLLACPFMHMFMHRGHAEHGGHGGHGSSRQDTHSPEPESKTEARP